MTWYDTNLGPVLVLWREWSQPLVIINLNSGVLDSMGVPSVSQIDLLEMFKWFWTVFIQWILKDWDGDYL